MATHLTLDAARQERWAEALAVLLSLPPGLACGPVSSLTTTAVMEGEGTYAANIRTCRKLS